MRGQVDHAGAVLRFSHIAEQSLSLRWLGCTRAALTTSGHRLSDRVCHVQLARVCVGVIRWNVSPRCCGLVDLAYTYSVDIGLLAAVPSSGVGRRRSRVRVGRIWRVKAQGLHDLAASCEYFRGGLTEDGRVASGPVGDVGDGVVAAVQAGEGGDEVGDGFGFYLCTASTCG
jgi:hypothetical protein